MNSASTLKLAATCEIRPRTRGVTSVSDMAAKEAGNSIAEIACKVKISHNAARNHPSNNPLSATKLISPTIKTARYALNLRSIVFLFDT